jgi:hypothetical protein
MDGDDFRVYNKYGCSWCQEKVPYGTTGIIMTPPAEVIAQVEAIARAARLDVGGIEFLVDDRDGEVYFYDVNALSNFVADAPNVVGFDPWVHFVDYLVARRDRRSGAGFGRPVAETAEVGA